MQGKTVTFFCRCCYFFWCRKSNAARQHRFRTFSANFYARKQTHIHSNAAGIPESEITISPNQMTDAHGVVRVQVTVPYRAVTWLLCHVPGIGNQVQATSTILTERFSPTQHAAITTLATEHVNDFESPTLRVDEI